MDFADEATAAEERFRDQAIAARRVTPPRHNDGLCNWCRDPVEICLEFCDSDCRDDWERANAKKC